MKTCLGLTMHHNLKTGSIVNWYQSPVIRVQLHIYSIKDQKVWKQNVSMITNFGEKMMLAHNFYNFFIPNWILFWDLPCYLVTTMSSFSTGLGFPDYSWHHMDPDGHKWRSGDLKLLCSVPIIKSNISIRPEILHLHTYQYTFLA